MRDENFNDNRNRVPRIGTQVLEDPPPPTQSPLETWGVKRHTPTGRHGRRLPLPDTESNLILRVRVSSNSCDQYPESILTLRQEASERRLDVQVEDKRLENKV